MVLEKPQTDVADEIVALSDQLAKAYEELTLIYKLNHNLDLTEDIANFFDDYIDELMNLVDVDSVVLYSLLPSHKILKKGQDLGDVEELVTSLQGISDNSKELVLLNKANSDFIGLSAEDWYMVVIRLFSRNKVLGLFIAVRFKPIEFTSDQIKLLLTTARHISWFLENKSLLNNLYDLLMGVLNTLVSVIDAKDKYTRGHSQRVAYISGKIAQAIGLPTDEVQKIYLAGLLHDIGKVGIEDSILRKPGKLSAEEFEIVRKHPIVGAKIISSLKYLQDIKAGVLYHHERYNGSGYPEGLESDQIPLMGAIVGLADWLDAITSDRTYRKAISFDSAVREAISSSGKLFSPLVVEGLRKCDLNQLKTKLLNISSHSLDLLLVRDLHWLVR